MTDLVQKLVGALETSRAYIARYGYTGEQLAIIDAALSEAKAGGWLPIEQVAYRVDWPVEAGVGMRRFYGADEWESSRGTVEFFGGVPVPLYALPAPPAQKDPT